jgi:hypothetical protein
MAKKYKDTGRFFYFFYFIFFGMVLQFMGAIDLPISASASKLPKPRPVLPAEVSIQLPQGQVSTRSLMAGRGISGQATGNGVER